MTDSMKFDPEGLLPLSNPWAPKVETVEDEIKKADHALVINGLTEEQFDRLSKGVINAMKQDPRSRTGLVIGKVAAFAMLMLFLAGIVRVIVWILSGLTINA